MEAVIKLGHKGAQVKALQQRLNELGFQPGSIDGWFGPKTEAVVKEFQAKNNLKVDGIVGPTTTLALRVAKIHEFVKSAQEVDDRHKAERAFAIAVKEIGTREKVGKGKTNARITEYHSKTTLKATEDEVPWCASFVCWVLATAGLKHTASARAKDYATYGRRGTGAVGDIAVFTRAGGGHVGFIAKPYKKGDKYIYLLGGNQGDAVTYKNYSAGNLIAIRSV